jgi:hypothetical protein
MSSSYEFILTDDSGRKIAQLDKYSFASYSRTTQGFGAIQFGLSYDYYQSLVPDIFKPDWRIDVWRKPDDDFPMRREGSFFLRKYLIAERVDGMRTIEFYGRSPLDILRRGSMWGNYTQTDVADDAMKQIVRDAIALNSLVPIPYVVSGVYEDFTVDVDASLGPAIDISFQGYSVLDILTDIKQNTILLNKLTPTSRKIYFDVVEYNTLDNGGFGYIFKTYADLRGQDRTAGGSIFSSANGNLRKPVYYEDYLDQVTQIAAIYSDDSVDANFTAGDDRFASRWNTITKSIFVGDTTGVGNYKAYVELAKGKVKKVFSADFLNTPGGPTQPRSLYGVDWDMGDLVRAEFADKAFDAEIKVVHIAVDENGRENIVGQTEVGG